MDSDSEGELIRNTVFSLGPTRPDKKNKKSSVMQDDGNAWDESGPHPDAPPDLGEDLDEMGFSPGAMRSGLHGVSIDKGSKRLCSSAVHPPIASMTAAISTPPPTTAKATATVIKSGSGSKKRTTSGISLASPVATFEKLMKQSSKYAILADELFWSSIKNVSDAPDKDAGPVGVDAGEGENEIGGREAEPDATSIGEKKKLEYLFGDGDLFSVSFGQDQPIQFFEFPNLPKRRKSDEGGSMTAAVEDYCLMSHGGLTRDELRDSLQSVCSYYSDPTMNGFTRKRKISNLMRMIKGGPITPDMFDIFILPECMLTWSPARVPPQMPLGSTTSPSVGADAGGDWIKMIFDPLLAGLANTISKNPQRISRDEVHSAFILMTKACFDIRIYNFCWKSIHSLATSILSWLDIDRLVLFVEWYHLVYRGLGGLKSRAALGGLFRICKVLNHDANGLGQPVAKSLIDSHLSALRSATIDKEQPVLGEGEEGIQNIIEMLIQDCENGNDDRSRGVVLAKEIMDWYPRLRVMALRLFMTLFPTAATGQKNEEIIQLIRKIKASIPSTHYPIIIATRELLSKVETHLRIISSTKNKKESIAFSSWSHEPPV